MGSTIRDVAEAAGVSIATVSRFLNNPGLVSPKTAEKVREVCEILEFKRNEAACSLKTGKTKTIGLMAPEISNVFFTQIIEQLEKNLSPFGYRFVIASSNNSTKEEAGNLRSMLDRGVDGIVVIPVSDKGTHFDRKKLGGTPIVMCDRSVKDAEIDVVHTDNFKGSYLATEALIKEGFTRIGHIAGGEHVDTSRERLRGYIAALKDHNLAVDEDFILKGNMSQQSGYELMEAALRHPECPNAFFICNDSVHIGASSYLLSSVPYEVRRKMVFASFDYMQHAPLLTNCHYAVEQPLREMGDQVAKLLLKRISGDNSDWPKNVVLEPNLKVMVDNGGKIFSAEAEAVSFRDSPGLKRMYT